MKGKGKNEPMNSITEKMPPKKALQFLRWYCREDYIDEIEGDLIELFEKRCEESDDRANRRFVWDVIKSFRRRNMKSKSINSNKIMMLKNNLKIGWRSLKSKPFFTLLNTFGLAIGMAATPTSSRSNRCACSRRMGRRASR